MRIKIYEDDHLIIFKESEKYFLRYDAGSHQISIREDEITKMETQMIMKSFEDASKVLFILQDRLLASGIKPYLSNVEINELKVS